MSLTNHIERWYAYHALMARVCFEFPEVVDVLDTVSYIKGIIVREPRQPEFQVRLLLPTEAWISDRLKIDLNFEVGTCKYLHNEMEAPSLTYFTNAMSTLDIERPFFRYMSRYCLSDYSCTCAFHYI